MNDSSAAPIRLHRDLPPVEIPEGYIGPMTLPGNGRPVYWTGRVAIGLRHQAPAAPGGVSQSALWIQDLMLAA